MSEVVVVATKKPFRKWLWFGGIFVFLLVAGCIALSIYVGWNLTHPERSLITETPAKYGLQYENISFQSRVDRLQMKGWYLPAKTPNGTTIIVAHGYKKNRLQDDVPVISLAGQLIDRGYSMLIFDFRNSGESEGDVTSVGQFEKNDLLGAVDWVKKNTNQQIVLLGYSMGGATSLLAAAEETEVQAVISDSAFNNLTAYLKDN
jgi:predicted alpha/beta-fold hydrolase